MERKDFVGKWFVGSSGRREIIPEGSILTIDLAPQPGSDFDVHIQPKAAKKVRLTSNVRFDDASGQIVGAVVYGDLAYRIFLSQCSALSSTGKKVIFGTIFPSKDGIGEDGGATGGWSAEETEGSGGHDD